ncbi:hypothetical protein [Paraglaciecola sp. 25GB23A]|uniref:hypothetical protein n=1 Tax=Paraglaciecola sp. 25GB23A TaxID=3156068 RepID=UPI0032AF2C46
MNPILEMLQNSDLLSSAAAVSEFEEFDIEISKDPVSCEELLYTYQQRVEHLSQFTTEHAVQLKASTDELCSNLRNHKEEQCLFHTLKGSVKHQYNLVVLKNSNILLGCLKTVSKLNVTEQEWLHLWGSKS